jgi:hypothetical protein
MKAKLEFDLDDFDDRIAHERCVKATDMAIVLWELATNSYKKILRGTDTDEKMPEGYYDGVDAVFKHFRELLEENDINPDKLIV